MSVAILCVDDQREVLAALAKDLAPFVGCCEVLTVESAAEAEELIAELEDRGIPLAVVISDQVMPGTTGVELLTRIDRDGRHPHLRKVLLTGQASHGDTIAAINQARIHSYVAKPWDVDALVADVKGQLTAFILAAGIPYGPYQGVLDQTVLLDHLRRHGADR